MHFANKVFCFVASTFTKWQFAFVSIYLLQFPFALYIFVLIKIMNRFYIVSLLVCVLNVIHFGFTISLSKKNYCNIRFLKYTQYNSLCNMYIALNVMNFIFNSFLYHM